MLGQRLDRVDVMHEDMGRGHVKQALAEHDERIVAGQAGDVAAFHEQGAQNQPVTHLARHGGDAFQLMSPTEGRGFHGYAVSASPCRGNHAFGELGEIYLGETGNGQGYQPGSP